MIWRSEKGQNCGSVLREGKWETTSNEERTMYGVQRELEESRVEYTYYFVRKYLFTIFCNNMRWSISLFNYLFQLNSKLSQWLEWRHWKCKIHVYLKKMICLLVSIITVTFRYWITMRTGKVICRKMEELTRAWWGKVRTKYDHSKSCQ